MPVIVVTVSAACHYSRSLQFGQILETVNGVKMMPCLAVVSHGNVTTPARVLVFGRLYRMTATAQCGRTPEMLID